MTLNVACKDAGCKHAAQCVSHKTHVEGIVCFHTQPSFGLEKEKKYRRMGKLVQDNRKAHGPPQNVLSCRVYDITISDHAPVVFEFSC